MKIVCVEQPPDEGECFHGKDSSINNHISLQSMVRFDFLLTIACVIKRGFNWKGESVN